MKIKWFVVLSFGCLLLILSDLAVLSIPDVGARETYGTPIYIHALLP